MQECVIDNCSRTFVLLVLGDITSDLALVLLNAVYFKGNWKDKFDVKDTELKPFHLTKNTTIEVPTMHIKKKYFYRTIDELNAQCIKLPYEVNIMEINESVSQASLLYNDYFNFLE